MTQREAEFLQRLRATFLVEAREHLQTVASSLLALEKAQSAVERGQQLEIAFRHTHSLKGAARAASYPRIEAICQGVEEVFALCKRRGRILGPAEFDTLHRAFELVRSEVDAGGAAPAGAFVEQAGRVTRALQAIAAGGRNDADAVQPAVEAAAPAETPDGAGDATGCHSGSDRSTAEPRPVAAADTVRVETPRLDRILRSAEELLTVKQAAAERADELFRLEHHLDEWSAHWLAVQPSLRRLRDLERALPAGPDGEAFADAPRKVLEFAEWTFGHVKSLESRLRAASRASARDRHLASKQIDELLDESKGLLMMPFETIANLIPLLVRDLAREQGKDIDLQLVGSGVQLDKRVLEQLKDPLVHLVRNAVDHGIEVRAEREARGKPATATLRVEARLVHGNKVEIVVADDGGGIDVQRLRAVATRSALISQDEASQLDDAGAVELAFRSDVSTSPIITEISGRGLGLPIVREHVEKLGGRVSVENRAPDGATFTITLPQTLATLRGVFVQAANQDFVIPTTHVERVARCPSADVKTVSGRDTVTIDGAAVAMVRLGDVLELGRRADDADAGYITVVLVGSGRDRIALAVDDVLHDDEVLVKRLQRPLVRVRNVAGATILASGRIVPILNIADLLKSARRVGDSARAVAPAGAGEGKAIARKILVAEDSITSRLLLKGILEAAGCEVKTVVDGIEAFTALRSEYFDLLVSDVEMPRLNGFDLTARIRADRNLADLPVILVTALSRREDRERGIDVGANAYIPKGGFDQGDLLDAVRRLAGTRERT